MPTDKQHTLLFDAITQAVNSAAKNMRKILIKKGKKASGKLVKSITVKGDMTPNSLTFDVIAESYAKWVDKGRRPGGRKPPLKPLLRWVRIVFKLKGKKARQAAFAVQTNVAKFGIKPTNFIQESISETEKQLKKKGEEGLKKEADRGFEIIASVKF